MTLYNYKAFLDLDDDTYNAWENRFTRIEEQALRTVKDLCPEFDVKKANKAVHSYCEEVLSHIGVELPMPKFMAISPCSIPTDH